MNSKRLVELERKVDHPTAILTDAEVEEFVELRNQCIQERRAAIELEEKRLAAERRAEQRRGVNRIKHALAQSAA